MRRLAWATARHLALASLIVIVVVIATAFGTVAWLSRHPLSLTPLAPSLAERLSDPASGRVVDIRDVTLVWSDDAFDGNGRLEIHLAGVAVRGADGATIASAPEAVLGLSVSGLLRGVVRPTRLELVGPKVVVFRRSDDSLGFTVVEPSAPAAGDAAEGESTPVALDALGALAAPPDRDRLLGQLRVVAVRDGDVTVIDPGRSLRWHAKPTRISLERSDGGVEGGVRLSLDVGSAAVPMEATVRFDATERRTRVTAEFTGLVPDLVADAADALAPARGIIVPVSGTLTATLGADFRLEAVDFAITGGEGEVTLPTPDGETRYPVAGASLKGSLSPKDRRVILETVEARLADMELSATGAVDYAGTVPLGSVDARLTVEGRVATFSMSARAEAGAGPGAEGDDEIAVEGVVEDLEPARLAALTPLLAPAGAFDGMVSGSLSGRLSAQGRPLSGSARLGIGPGTLNLPGVLPQPLRLGGGVFAADADRDTGGFGFSVERLELTDGPDGPFVNASVRSTREEGRDRLRATLALGDLSMTDLQRYWPPLAGPKPRAWMVENVTDGYVIAADMAVEGSIPVSEGFPTLNTLEGIAVEEMNARLETRDLEIHYFRPLPPIRDVTSAVANYDGKDINIITTGGALTMEGLEPVTAREARIKITNIATPREDLFIDVDLQGALKTILTVIDLPPLGYPSKLDIDPARTGGMVDGRLRIAFPLFDNLKLDDIIVQVDGRGRDVALSKLVMGRDVDQGDVNVSLDTAGMTVEGKARFDRVPLKVQWTERFSPQPKETRTELTARGRADFTKVADFVPVLGPYGSGPVDLDMTYQQWADGTARLDTRFDLTPTKVFLGPLGWSKSSGGAARGKASLHLRDGDLLRVDDISVTGADMSASGEVIFDRDGEPSRISFPRVKAGATDVSIIATPLKGDAAKGGAAKGGGLDVKVTGAVFDATALMKGDGAGGADGGRDGPDPKSPRMVIQLTTDRLALGADRGLTDAKARLVRVNGEWNDIAIRGNTPPGGMLLIRMGPSRDGGSRIRIDADDAGAALRALDVTDRVRGGKLTIRGRSAKARPRAPVEGTITLRDYTLVDAPALAGLLNAMSITGLVDLLKGEGISFGSLTGRFAKDGDKLSLMDVRTAGGALGLTVEGDIDLGSEAARLNGTIVPVYGLNRIIGQIPLLGDVLSGGPGQGIFAATWTLDGPLSNPEVSVNPLAMLAPGFLRQLFFSGPGDGAATDDDDPDPPEWDHFR